ncbi:MAG: 50S ribosomal protein L25 [Candidatus Buchananbacteria bacterium]
MSIVLSLKGKTRKEQKKKVSQLRTSDQIPAVLYGHKIKPQNIVVDYTLFEKIFKQAGESTLVDLSIDDGKPAKVLIQDYQLAPLTNRFTHVDFHLVNMDEKIHTAIGLKFIGEAPAVKERGGILVTNIHEIEVSCLPKDLIHEIEVDLSGLKTFEDTIRISDLKIPAGISLQNVPTDLVVLVQAPRSEKELADLESKPEATLPVAEEAAKPTEEKSE